MHAIYLVLAEARIADLRRAAERHRLARSAREAAPTNPRTDGSRMAPPARPGLMPGTRQTPAPVPACVPGAE